MNNQNTEMIISLIAGTAMIWYASTQSGRGGMNIQMGFHNKIMDIMRRNYGKLERQEGLYDDNKEANLRVARGIMNWVRDHADSNSSLYSLSSRLDRDSDYLEYLTKLAERKTSIGSVISQMFSQ
jgi:hypothetical protein